MPTSRFRHARNPLTLFGIWLTTVSSVLFLVVFLADVFGVHTNPYIGILFFLVLPSLFVFGLLLIPAGIVLSRRRERQGRAPAELRWPIVDLNVPHQRRLALFILGATVVNIVVLGLATYRGVEYMDSPAFCGQVCHTVMKPEFTAYLNGPHARVACVGCHIGPGAPWFVKSKLSGTRQLFAVALETYPTPIPSPVENLRPARDTCEQCHWPQKFTGDRLRTIHEFAEDEANTATTSNLRLHVGSGQEKLGATGIHWHMSPSVRVSYITTDGKRQTIPYVEVDDGSGKIRKYRAEGVTDEEPARGERPVHPPRGRCRAEGHLSLPGRCREGHCGPAADLLPHPVPREPRGPAGGHQAGRDDGSGPLCPQRLPRHEGDLGHLPEQHRPPGLPGLLPVPRRRPQGVGRQRDQPGLLDLPHDRGVDEGSGLKATSGAGATWRLTRAPLAKWSVVPSFPDRPVAECAGLGRLLAPGCQGPVACTRLHKAAGPFVPSFTRSHFG